MVALQATRISHLVDFGKNLRTFRVSHPPGVKLERDTLSRPSPSCTEYLLVSRRRRTLVSQATAITSQNTAAGWQILTAVICTTIAFLAALALSFVMYLRPLLKELERLAVTCRDTAQSMEKASAEFETTSKIMNKDLPTTLDSMERAGLEFEELGQSLNILTGGLVRRNKPANARKAVAKAQAAAAAANTEIGMHEEALTSNVDNKGSSAIHEWNAVEALQAGTLASIRKVAQDVSSLTAALAPAMVAWRKRLGFMIEREEDPSSANSVTSQIGPASPAAADKEHPDKKHLDDQGRLNGILSSSGEQPVGPDKELQGGASSEEVAKVVKDVTEAALKALDPNASDSKSTTNLLQEEQDRTQKFRSNKDEFSHHVTESAIASSMGTESEAEAGQKKGNEPGALNEMAELASGSEASEATLSRQEAAAAVFSALANAEKAAMAAAEASGQLEHALQNAERQAGVPTPAAGWVSSLKNNNLPDESPESGYDDGMAFQYAGKDPSKQ